MHTRLGVNREVVRNVIARWPDINDSNVDSNDFITINNCLNEICHGLHISQQEWDERFTVPKSQILECFRHWSHRR
jgi:hypothetical protein